MPLRLAFDKQDYRTSGFVSHEAKSSTLNRIHAFHRKWEATIVRLLVVQRARREIGAYALLKSPKKMGKTMNGEANCSTLSIELTSVSTRTRRIFVHGTLNLTASQLVSYPLWHAILFEFSFVNEFVCVCV